MLSAYPSIIFYRLENYQSEELAKDILFYPELSLISMESNKSDFNKELSGELWKNDSLIYQSEFPFNELVYEGKNKTKRIIPLPYFEFDQLMIIGGSGQTVLTMNIDFHGIL